MTKQLPRDFKGIWIPKEMWLDDRLTSFEKMLLAEIDSLDCEPDHCYASNEHFGKMFEIGERSISNAISKFKRLGLVEQINFDGRTRVLKSWVKSAYEKLYGSATQKEHSKKDFTGLPSEKIRVSSIGDSIEPEIKDERKEESPIVPKGDPPSRKSKKEEKKELAPGVWVTKTQHDDLLRRCDGDENKIKTCYDRLSKWKIGKEISGGKNDYASITNWVIDAIEKDLKNGKVITDDVIKNRKHIAEKIVQKFPAEVSKNHIQLQENSLLFCYIGCFEDIPFTENGFEDRVFSRLRKMNLDVSHLI